MAWKTPGVYFTEIDNTDYQNPTSTVATTVAIIGFAKKGPIGVPTEITSYNTYKNIFGSPIDGQFAGLAVKNVLSSGGTVLFTRIADASLASKSNVILKNGVEATDGKLVINRSIDITKDNTSEFEYSTVYAGTITSPQGVSKTLVLRTPKEGKLKTSYMLNQFNESLKPTYGYTEYKLKKEITTSSVRSFKLQYSGTDKETGAQINNQEVGPFFVSVIGKDKGTGSPVNTVNNLKSIFSKSILRTNAYQKLYIFGNGKNGLESFENGKLGYRLPTEANLQLKFNLDIRNYKGVISSNYIAITCTPSSDDSDSGYYVTLETLANELNNALSNYGIYVKLCYNVERDDEGHDRPYLLFVALDTSLDTGIEEFDIYPDYDKDHNLKKDSMFVQVLADGFDYNEERDIDTYQHYEPGFIGFKNYAYVDVDGSGFGKLKYVVENKEEGQEGSFVPEESDEDLTSFKGLFCAKLQCVPSMEHDKNYVNIEYKETTNSILFKVNNNMEVKNSKIEVLPTNFENYLLFNNTIDIMNSTSENSAEVLKLKNDNNISISDSKGYLVSFVGEEGLDEYNYKVAVIDGKITFFEPGNLIPGSLDGTSPYKNYENISGLIGKVISEDEFEERMVAGSKCVVEKIGSNEIDSSKQDMVIFTAREYGEGTSNIGVRVYTSTSPIDGIKTRYISTIVDGVVKETWEDISCDPAKPNFFVNLINEEPENDGSNYIKVSAVKNDTTTAEILLNDTSYYTGDTELPVYIGRPVNSKSINRNVVAATEDSYTEYDYSVGNNGIPEDSTDLFLDAMNTMESGLSNKDLYAWHILITPDNISEEVQDSAIALCEYMEDAIYIADPPQGLSRDKVVKWHNGKFARSSALTSNYACTYWPWCKVYDTTSGKYVWAMPSIVMAAQFCLTDKDHSPWYAPAGEMCGTLNSVSDIEEYPNKNDRDQMYLDQNRVNPILRYKNGNIVVFGEKTTQRKNSTLTKIHTRRMLISLKHQLRNALKGYIFLPTMTNNISKIRATVTAIMESVKVGGGITSYKVICDGTNNTTETLQQDILNVAISCVPTGCIEQVEISFTLNKSEESIS